MKLDHVFKGLEFIGALVAATSIANMPDKDLQKLKEQLGLTEPSEQDKQEEQPHDMSNYTDEERAAIEKYLNAMKSND